jgi:hypothetical protein
LLGVVGRGALTPAAKNFLQGHPKVIHRYYTQTIGDPKRNILHMVRDLQTQGQGHLKVKYRYYTQTSPGRMASCSNMVRDLEGELQGHLVGVL